MDMVILIPRLFLGSVARVIIRRILVIYHCFRKCFQHLFYNFNYPFTPPFLGGFSAEDCEISPHNSEFL
jgi:hypothetical protein